MDRDQGLERLTARFVRLTSVTRRKLVAAKETIHRRVNGLFQKPVDRPISKIGPGGRDRRSQPILVFQMGRVASNTVQRTVATAALSSPIYRVHVLSDAGCSRLQAYSQNMLLPAAHRQSCERQYAKAQEIRRLLAAGARPKVITLCRDPIAVFVSGFFQSFGTIFPDVERRRAGTFG